MAVFVAATAAASVEAFQVPQPQTSRTASTTNTSQLQNAANKNNSNSDEVLSVSSRREILFGTATAAAAALGGLTLPSPVWASGGATAGKYTYVGVLSQMCSLSS